MSTNGNERRILLDLAVTLDGFIEGKNGEIDWCIMDDEMQFMDFLNRIDTILYGRKSYDLWGEFTPDAMSAAEQELWEAVHRKQKVVFSKTQNKPNRNVKYINDYIADEVLQMKKQPGKDMWLYGGASLITTFMNLGLVDEFRLAVHPVILGEGKPLFIDIKQRVNLELVDTRTYSSGVVQLIYNRSDK